MPAPTPGATSLAQEWHGNRLVHQWGGQGAEGRQRRSTLTAWLHDALSLTFLPEGFPKSVSADYLSFQVWDTAQAISSYVRGMLSSQAIMQGIGVGKEAATAYGAVFMFAVRDMTGMLGGLVFAHMEGSGFDSCAKQWRLFADVMNDIAMAVDLASPLFPKAFLLLACLASLARAVTGVAGGATRAALTQHFARDGNAADIAAKEQSQETAVTAIGMVLGMLLTRFCSSSHAWAWAWFSLLTAVHIWANVRAMRALVLTSLNQPRLEALLQLYREKGTILSPREMSSQEDLMPPPFKRLLQRLLPYRRGTGQGPAPSIQLGASLRAAAAAAAAGSGAPRPLQEQQAQQEAAVRLLLKEQGHQRYLLVDSGPQLLLVLHTQAEARDVLQAYVHAWKVCEGKGSNGGAGSCKAADAWMQEHFGALVQQLEGAGWQLGRVMLPRGSFSAQWQICQAHKD